jgi:GAF domain-containing protein
MAEAFDPGALPAARAARYAELADEIAAVLEGEPDRVARMATVSSMLAAAFAPRFFWTGFYVVDPARPGELVVGPIRGRWGVCASPSGEGCAGRRRRSGGP